MHPNEIRVLYHPHQTGHEPDTLADLAVQRLRIMSAMASKLAPLVEAIRTLTGASSPEILHVEIEATAYRFGVDYQEINEYQPLFTLPRDVVDRGDLDAILEALRPRLQPR